MQLMDARRNLLELFIKYLDTNIYVYSEDFINIIET